MNSQEEYLLREEAKALPGIPRNAIDVLKGQFANLLNLVNEKFEVQARFCCEKSAMNQTEFLNEAHRYFGEILLSAFEFQMYERLVGEFSWFISAMRHRDFHTEYFETLLNAWLTSMHGVLPPSVVHDVAKPIQFLLEHLKVFLQLPEQVIQTKGKEQRDFVSILLENKRRDATEYVLSIAQGGASPEDLCKTLVVPSLRYIGYLWQINEIRVADEHAATEICRYITFRLCDSIPREKDLPYRAFVSCVQGEEHSLAVEMIGAYLEAKGWSVYFVGRGAPRDDIVQSVIRYQPHVIFLSITVFPNLPLARELLVSLREKAPDSKIVLGGAAAVAAKSYWGKMVDLVAEDMEEGHAAALKLLDHHA